MGERKFSEHLEDIKLGACINSENTGFSGYKKQTAEFARIRQTKNVPRN